MSAVYALLKSREPRYESAACRLTAKPAHTHRYNSTAEINQDLRNNTKHDVRSMIRSPITQLNGFNKCCKYE